MKSNLKKMLDITMDAARIEREESGRSERGRAASIVYTDLEKIDALVCYYGLDQEPKFGDDDPE